jgi:hypothetical protein
MSDQTINSSQNSLPVQEKVRKELTEVQKEKNRQKAKENKQKKKDLRVLGIENLIEFVDSSPKSIITSVRNYLESIKLQIQVLN